LCGIFIPEIEVELCPPPGFTLGFRFLPLADIFGSVCEGPPHLLGNDPRLHQGLELLLDDRVDPVLRQTGPGPVRFWVRHPWQTIKEGVASERLQFPFPPLLLLGVLAAGIEHEDLRVLLLQEAAPDSLLE